MREGAVTTEVIMQTVKGADVASTGSMTLGDDGNYFDITGTTTITSVTIKTAGTVVHLQFDGILTFTDGSNLSLQGDFTTAAGSVISLVSDGTNWVEVSRSPNVDSDVALNTTHRTSTGADHSYIDQSVVSGGSPTFDGNNFTGVDADDVDIADGGGIITATDVEGALAENRTAIDLNTAKVTNATHTTDVTGSTSLTVDPVAITNKSAGTVASGDLVLIADIDDSNNLKKVTASSIGALGGGGGATLDHDVNQVTHGFSVNDWVYNTGGATTYALADASAAATAESVGVISAVADVDNFTVQFGGRITGLTGLTAGEAHFLSETAGAITATEPTTEDAIIKPVLVADSTTTGFIFNMRGSVITDPVTSFFQSFVDGDLTAGKITITHNLGHKYVIAQVYDNNDLQILADEIDLTGDNALELDLTSYGTLTGTWRIVIIDMGSTATAGASFNTTFVDGDLSTGVLTITHNLSSQYNNIQIYDNSDDLVQPDDITATSTTVTTVDLSTFGTLTGTWKAVVISSGNTQTSTASDLSLSGQAIGDTAYFDGTNWVRLPAGTDTYHLRANGAAAPSWEAVSAGSYATAAVHATKSGTQSNIALATDVTVTWDSPVFDLGTDFVAGTGIFTAPKTGKYYVGGYIRFDSWDSAATSYGVKILYSNGNYTIVSDGVHLSSDGKWSHPFNGFIDMDTSDTLKIEVRQDGGTQQTDIVDGKFDCFLVA